MNAKKIVLAFLASSIAVTSVHVGRDEYLENPKTSGVYLLYPFDTPIKVGFFDETPSIGNLISVDRYDRKWRPYRSSLWSGLCGDQDSAGTDECNKSKGRVIFQKGQDQTHHDAWPLNPGYFYEVCLWDTPIDGDSIVPDGYCFVIKIQNISPETVDNSVVRTITVGNDVQLFYKTKKGYSRFWVALFRVENFDDFETDKVLPKDEVWKKVTKKQAMVTFKDVSPGEYKACLVFEWNKPYTVFKCQQKTVFVSGEP